MISNDLNHLRSLSLLDKFDDLGQRGVHANMCSTDEQGAILVDGACNHSAPGLLSHRHGLTWSHKAAAGEKISQRQQRLHFQQEPPFTQLSNTRFLRTDDED